MKLYRYEDIKEEMIPLYFSCQKWISEVDLCTKVKPVEAIPKDEVIDMLKKIVEDITNIDLPQRDPFYLDGFSEAQYQIQVDIQKKIYELRGETDE